MYEMVKVFPTRITSGSQGFDTISGDGVQSGPASRFCTCVFQLRLNRSELSLSIVNVTPQWQTKGMQPYEGAAERESRLGIA